MGYKFFFAISFNVLNLGAFGCSWLPYQNFVLWLHLTVLTLFYLAPHPSFPSPNHPFPVTKPDCSHYLIGDILYTGQGNTGDNVAVYFFLSNKFDGISSNDVFIS